MTKLISRTLMSLIFLIFSIGAASYAGIPEPPAESSAEFIRNMNTHIEKVKLKNPSKYQFMVKRAGGNPAQCTDCHQELLKGNLPGQNGIESIRPLRK